MVTRRKTWTLIGHSQGEGLAGSSPLYKAYPHLQVFGPVGGPAGSRDAAKYRKHPGLKMFVTANRWPTPGGSPPGGSISVGSWLDMTLDACQSPGVFHAYGSPHHASPTSYQFPSGRSVPFTPSAYVADPAFGGIWPVSTGGGGLTGVELPLAHKLSQYWGENVYGIKLAVPSSLFLRYDQGNFGYTQYGWWTPGERFDFDPTTGRLWQSMDDKCVAAAAALPAGEKLDIRLSIFWLGDNDSTLSPERITHFKDAYKKAIATWRARCVEQDWTTLPAHQIPIIMMGIYDTYNTPNRDQINIWLQEIEDEDPYVRFVPTMGHESCYSAGFVDRSHLSHNGYYTIAEEILLALKDVDVAPTSAMDKEDLITVDEVRTRIRTFYENNNVRTGATNDTTLLTHINGALLHIFNKLGDQCYWLRSREELEFSSQVGQVHTMPGYIQRVLRIENPNNPDDFLRFQMIGLGEGGKLQILMKDRASGTYTFHIIKKPKELTVDDELVPVPREALEWLVTEACYRVARGTNNVALRAELKQDSMMLHQDMSRHAAATIRARNDRLRVQHHLRGRVNYRGGGYWRRGLWL